MSDEPLHRYDPPVGRYQPNPELVSRAQRHMMEQEDQEASGTHRFVRQRWEEAFGALKVALAALGEVYPAEAQALSPSGREKWSYVLGQVTDAFAEFDMLSGEMLGPVFDAVLSGTITTLNELHEAMGVEHD